MVLCRHGQSLQRHLGSNVPHLVNQYLFPYFKEVNATRSSQSGEQRSNEVAIITPGASMNQKLSLPCPNSQCTSTFSTDSNLKRHLGTTCKFQSGLMMKPHHCKWSPCKHSSYQISDLKKHEKICKFKILESLVDSRFSNK